MGNTANPTPSNTTPRLRVQLLLAGVHGAAAGAVRACVTWVLAHLTSSG